MFIFWGLLFLLIKFYGLPVIIFPLTFLRISVVKQEKVQR